MLLSGEIQEIIVRNSKLSDVGRPQLEQTVHEAEAALGVKFPVSYREYLQQWGWVSFGPTEFMGLGSEMNNVVERTMALRHSLDLPFSLVLVCDQEGDEYDCLETALTNKGECPVVVWDPISRTVERRRAASFEEYLANDLSALEAALGDLT